MFIYIYIYTYIQSGCLEMGLIPQDMTIWKGQLVWNLWDFGVPYFQTKPRAKSVVPLQVPAKWLVKSHFLMVKPPLLLLKMISFLVGPPCLLEPAQILFNLPIFYPVVVVEEVVVIVEEVVEEEVVVVEEVVVIVEEVVGEEVVVVEEVVVIVEEVVEEEVVVVVEVEVEVVPPFPARPRLSSWLQRPSAVSAAWWSTRMASASATSWDAATMSLGKCGSRNLLSATGSWWLANIFCWKNSPLLIVGWSNLVTFICIYGFD